jgi:hypothetical protein
MREVYSTAGIRVVVASRETLTGSAFAALNSLDVGSCGNTPPTEQTQLYQNRNSVGNNEIVVYFVQSVIETAGGKSMILKRAFGNLTISYQISPSAQAALYDVERFLALVL